jgi:DNA-directed RNA polymerase subunit RPC12/RpoP
MTKELYICPECGSENICKLSLIHRKGIAHSSGLGITSRGGIIDISTRSQTAVSASVRPPTRPFFSFLRNLAIGIVFSIIGFLIFSMVRIFLSRVREDFSFFINSGYAAFVAFLLVKVVIINSCRDTVKYRSDIHRWRNSYQCQRCDSEFVLTEYLYLGVETVSGSH